MLDEEDGDEAGDAVAILKNLKTKWLPWQLTLYSVCLFVNSVSYLRKSLNKTVAQKSCVLQSGSSCGHRINFTPSKQPLVYSHFRVKFLLQRL